MRFFACDDDLLPRVVGTGWVGSAALARAGNDHKRAHSPLGFRLSEGIRLSAGIGETTFPAGGAPRQRVDVGRATRPCQPEAFAYLSVQHSNYCSLSADRVMGFDASAHLQGACCSSMDMAKYAWQVEGLGRYSSIPEVPKDPYDVTVGLAKQLLGYDTELSLTADQKGVYDSAMAMTEDKAPCCCQCWRWYMTRGLAKFLIVRHATAAPELASIVDLVNGCGGPMNEGGSAAAGITARLM